MRSFMFLGMIIYLISHTVLSILWGTLVGNFVFCDCKWKYLLMSESCQQGGTHVSYVTDQIVEKLMAAVKRRNKGGIEVKPFQIKNHLWVFINCLIENPTFDSQTKENMTLRAKAFGSTCDFTDKFIKQVWILVLLLVKFPFHFIEIWQMQQKIEK